MQAIPRIAQYFPPDKRCCPDAARDDAPRPLGDAPIQSQGHAPLAGLGPAARMPTAGNRPHPGPYGASGGAVVF